MKQQKKDIFAGLVCFLLLCAIFTLAHAFACFATEAQADFSLETKTALDFSALFKFRLPIVADYGSEDCPACRKMFSALKHTNEKYKGRAFVKYADVWKHRNTAGELPLVVIPTQFFFTSAGKPFIPSKKLSARLKFSLYCDKAGKHALTAHQGGLSEADFDEILKELGVK